MARYRFYTRAKTLALCPLGIHVLTVGGLSSAFYEDRQPPFLSPPEFILFYANIYPSSVIG